MIGNVHVAAVGIELAVNGRRVWEERHSGASRLLRAGVVIEGTIGGLDEPVTNFEGLIGKVAGLPDGEAGRVAVPVVVGFGNIAHVVDFFPGVILVHVLGLAVDGAFEVVAAVLDTPQATI